MSGSKNYFIAEPLKEILKSIPRSHSKLNILNAGIQEQLFSENSTAGFYAKPELKTPMIAYGPNNDLRMN